MCFDYSSAIKLIAVSGTMLTMIGGLFLVHSRLKHKDQGFGPNSIKALGLVLFLPSIVIIGITIPDFKTETIAALLGTVGGYILSHSKADDN